MKMHITNLYGINSRASAVIAQNNVVKIARELGFTEMGIPFCAVSSDSKSELRKQLDGITSALWQDDIVIFQFPSWNGTYYDKYLLKVIRLRANIRLAVFVHDMAPVMSGKENEDYQKIIDIFNMADLLIVPSERMLSVLRERGLTVKNIMIQSMFDLPFTEDLNMPEFRREIFFSGSQESCSFIETQNMGVPLRLFGFDSLTLNGKNLTFEGWKNTTELMMEYTKGGFGLIWEQAARSDYCAASQLCRLSAYLGAGIPVVVKKGHPHEETVLKYGLGFVVGSPGGAADRVRSVSEDEYFSMVGNIKNISFLIRGGFFTKKLLIDIVNYLMLG